MQLVSSREPREALRNFEVAMALLPRSWRALPCKVSSVLAGRCLLPIFRLLF